MKKLIFSISFLLMIISISTTTFALCSSQCSTQGYASGICRTSNTLPAPTQFNLISNPRDTPTSDHNVFHTHNNLMTMFKTLYDKYPGYASYEPIGKTYEGRDIVLFKIGNPNGGKILWDGAIHGWEDAGSEIEYLIAKWLLENGTTGIDLTAQRIIQQNLVLFVPVINMDSYERQDRDFTSCSYGVDLNRNFVKGWTPAACDSLHYPGTSGASEKETQAVRSVFQTYKPKFYVNVHYGGGPLLYYYNSTPSNYTLTKSILTRINQLSSQTGVTPYPIATVGSSGQTVGDASDYANAWLLEVAGDRTGCSCYSHTCDTYSDIVNTYYPKVLPIFLAMTEASAVKPTSSCQSGETNIGQDDCSSGLCCCSGATQKCFDGTAYGSCNTTNKPAYCSSGTLVNNCTYCGCPSSQSCNLTTNACYMNVQSCLCGAWTSGACGGSCPPGQRQQTRTCTPSGCTPTDGLGTSRCVVDSTCVVTSNLVSYWKFDEGLGTSTLDSSGFNNNGVFYGETFNDGTSYSGSTPTDLHTPSGRYGKALNFDGTSDYVKVPLSSVFDFGSGSFTIAFWMKGGYQAGYGYLFSKNYPGPRWYASAMIGTSEPGNAGRIRFYVGNDTAYVQPQTMRYYNDSVWHYVVLERNETSQLLIYVDGVKDQDNVITFAYNLSNMTIDPKNNLFIGTRSDLPTGSNSRWFNGTIDELRIWKRALNMTEIQNEMKSSMPISSPVASWSFEESGNFVNDSHIWINGKTNYALSFDGINDYVRIKDSSSLDMTNAITISAWIYLTSWPSTYPRIVSKEASTVAAPYALELDNPSKRALFCLFIGTSENCVDSGTNSISLNQWYYIVGTWDGTSSKIYINGLLKNSAALTGTMSATTNDILIGNNPSTNRQFAGIIDGVKIYNYALTGSNISTSYGLPAFTMPYVLGVIPELILSIISFVLVIIEFIVVMMIIEKLRRPNKRKK